MLDIFLLRIQSYRHMIFNYKISQSVIVCVMITITSCDSHLFILGAMEGNRFVSIM